MAIQQTSFYTEEELATLGLKSYGSNVKISRFARIYSASTICIGDNVRIDDFCILSGNISLGSHIHISPYVALYGALGIVMEDYTGISAHSVIYSAMDDFGGDYLIGPVHPKEKINVTGGKVTMKKFTQIGSHCVVFPNLTIGEGSVIGACSMLLKDTEPWGVYYGIPAIRKGERKKNMISLVEI